MDYFLEHIRHHSQVLNWKRAAWTFSWTSSDVPFIMWKLGKTVQCHSSFGIVHLRDIKDLTSQICHSVPREKEKIRSISAAGTRGRCVLRWSFIVNLQFIQWPSGSYWTSVFLALYISLFVSRQSFSPFQPDCSCPLVCLSLSFKSQLRQQQLGQAPHLGLF